MNNLIEAIEDLFANEELIAESDDTLVISVKREDYRRIMVLLEEQELKDEYCGVHCPRCNGTDLYGGPVDIDNGEALQEITCTDCKSTWTDLYKLTGYCYFEEGDDG